MYYSVLQMDRSTIKLQEAEFEKHNEQRKEAGLTWSEYLNGQSSDLRQREVEAQERQAEAMETVAGMLMMHFNYSEDMPSFSAEAMLEEAQHFASGGELQL